MAIPTVRDSFTTFFEGWLDRLQSFYESLKQPQSVIEEIEDEMINNLIEQILSHYYQYYEEKKKVAETDVFLVFSPPWFSSYERAFLWIAGFKPSLIFQLVNGTVGKLLTAIQSEMIERVRTETRSEQREIEEAMARFQETVGAPPLYPLVRKMGRLVDGEVLAFDNAMEKLKEEMLVLVERADGLRDSTAKKVAEILSPKQTVKVLAGFAEFQLRTRRLGLERDASRVGSTSIDMDSERFNG